MTAPAVTVITPAYDCERFLGQAVESVRQQTWKDWELLIVDDGSQDGTPEIARGFAAADDRVRYLPRDHAGLASAVRNSGLAEARGRFIAFLDADDAWLPEKLGQQVEVLQTHPEVLLVYANAFIIRGAKLTTEKLYPSSRARSCERYANLLWWNQIATSTVLARTESVRDAGGFRVSPRLRQSEDYDLWLRLCSRGEIRYIDDCLAFYRRHGASVSTDLAQLARQTFHMRWSHCRESGLLFPVLLAAQLKELARVVYFTLGGRPAGEGVIDE